MKRFVLVIAMSLATATSAGIRAAETDTDQRGTITQEAGTHRLHGMVNSVNAAAGRINITHDPVESLKWPKMRMNFKVQDPVMLEGLKAGTEVDFDLQKAGDEYRITKIMPVK